MQLNLLQQHLNHLRKQYNDTKNFKLNKITRAMNNNEWIEIC